MTGEHTVWVTSEVQPDGSYAVTVAFTDDVAVTLDTTRAAEYAVAVLDAVQAAEYDAAVLAQLHGLGLAEKAAATFIAEDLRPKRPPLRETGTPLELVPGISHRDRRGFLGVRIGGEQAGQWELSDARSHALAVLECAVAVRYDAVYHAALTGLLNIDDGKARAIVQDIGEHRSRS